MRLIIVSRNNDGAKVYVNIENICAIYPSIDNKETIIQFADSENYLEVIENVDTVIARMTGWE